MKHTCASLYKGGFSPQALVRYRVCVKFTFSLLCCYPAQFAPLTW